MSYPCIKCVSAESKLYSFCNSPNPSLSTPPPPLGRHEPIGPAIAPPAAGAVEALAAVDIELARSARDATPAGKDRLKGGNCPNPGENAVWRTSVPTGVRR